MFLMLRFLSGPVLASFLSLCLASLPSVSPAQSIQQVIADNPDNLQQQIRWDEALRDQKNSAGLRFHFTQTHANPSAGGHMVTYRVRVPGASQQQKYKLGVWKIGSDPQTLHVDVYVNGKGLLMSHPPRPDEENSEVLLDGNELDFATQAARGEPVRWVLSSADDRFAVHGTTVPFPVVGTGATCRIELRLADPEGQAILIYADGLPPNSKVPFRTLSTGRSATSEFNVDAKGHAVAISLAPADEKTADTLKVAVAEKQCNTSVEIPRGKGTYRPY